jgi:hypothetical protein
LSSACAIVLGSGAFTLARLPGVRTEDGIATAGLFGAVSASTLAAAMVMLEEQEVVYEAWVPALYPFMDIPALILAICWPTSYLARKKGGGARSVRPLAIIADSLQGLGAVGAAARPGAWAADQPRAGGSRASTTRCSAASCRS